MLRESLNLEIWDRLLAGKSLDGLSLEAHDGRIRIRGLVFPGPTVLSRFKFHGVEMASTDAGIVQGVKWCNFDFTGSKLAGLRLMGGSIENCLFDDCNLEGARFWATSFRDVSFKGANLRSSVLGGVHKGVRNIFDSVDFSAANLTGTIYEAARFERCTFINAKLVKIDFQTSTFTDCLFEGELDDVLFYRHGFRGDHYPPNEMVNVDFSRARLRHVGFRGLRLDRVQLPKDDEHIVLKNFAETLDLVEAVLRKQNDPIAKKLVAFIGIKRKWAVPDQTQGYVNAKDLADIVGSVGVDRFLAAVPAGSRLES